MSRESKSDKNANLQLEIPAQKDKKSSKSATSSRRTNNKAEISERPNVTLKNETNKNSDVSNIDCNHSAKSEKSNNNSRRSLEGKEDTELQDKAKNGKETKKGRCSEQSFIKSPEENVNKSCNANTESQDRLRNNESKEKERSSRVRSKSAVPSSRIKSSDQSARHIDTNSPKNTKTITPKNATGANTPKNKIEENNRIDTACSNSPKNGIDENIPKNKTGSCSPKNGVSANSPKNKIGANSPKHRTGVNSSEIGNDCPDNGMDSQFTAGNISETQAKLLNKLLSNNSTRTCVRRLLKSAQIPSRPSSSRVVSAFSPSSRMPNTVVAAPPRVDVMKPSSGTPTTFRKMYDRGDIPVTLFQDHRGHSLRWKVEIDKIDYHHYLPLFFDGLRETAHPYDYVSSTAVKDLLSRGGEKILPVVPQLILPLKHALNTKNPPVICTVLRVLQDLVLSSPRIGESLVPFYRQLLPALHLFKNKNVNIGDEIDYSQHRQDNLGDLIQDTLEALERHGGKDSYVNIKYMVPTYQSCLMN